MNRRDERTLHEYLDGRLDEEGRRELEARMASDPEIASRIAFHRSVRVELEKAPSELPPGFSLRARRRFEQAQAAPRSRGVPVFFLKAAGLAVATVLVVVLLVGRKPPGSPALPSKEQLQDKDERKEAPAEPAPTRAPASAPSVAPRGKRADRAAGNASALPAPREAAAPEPSSSADAAAPRVMAELLQKKADDSGTVPRCEELPGDARAPRSLFVINGPSDELSPEFNTGPATEALRRLGPDFKTERVVAIGAPCGCTGLGMVLGPGSVRVIVVRPDVATGCLLAIPAGSIPVEIEDQR